MDDINARMYARRWERARLLLHSEKAARMKHRQARATRSELFTSPLSTGKNRYRFFACLEAFTFSERCCYKLPMYAILLLLFLEVQRLRSNDITSYLTECGLEFLLEFLAAHDLGGLGNLAQQFLQTSDETDQAAFVDVCHFARWC